MAGSVRFTSSWSWVVLAIGLFGCSTDLNRDDIAGRHCPCMLGWTAQGTGGSCVCVLAGTTSISGGAHSTGGTIATGGTVGLGGTAGSGGASSGCPTPLPPPPEPSSCPSQCSTCANGICAINCIATGDCSNATINCPANMPCQLNCGAPSSCNTSYLYCPSQYSCGVSCSGKKSCIELNVSCSVDGPCALTCANDTQVCSGSQLNCGKNACKASCAGSKGNYPTVNQCSGSCQTNCACP
jgi:hypothetical protein